MPGTCPSITTVFLVFILSASARRRRCARAQLHRNRLQVHSPFPAISTTVATFQVLCVRDYCGRRSLAAIPFGTMLVMLSLWLFISCPLAFAGTILGRHCTPQYEPPCRVSVIPRIIPAKNWRLPLPVVLLLAGSLSFGSIFIEMFVKWLLTYF
jgi:hypothetical protein